MPRAKLWASCSCPVSLVGSDRSAWAREAWAGVVVGGILALLGWVTWAFLTYVIGTRLLAEPQTHADVGELMRTLGFAQAPGLLRVLGGFPGVGPLVLSIVSIWMLVAMVVAVRQALDYTSTVRAVGCVLWDGCFQSRLVSSSCS